MTSEVRGVRENDLGVTVTGPDLHSVQPRSTRLVPSVGTNILSALGHRNRLTYLDHEHH